MLCSIFMASTTHTSSPGETVSPGLTFTANTRPGIGEYMILSDTLDVGVLA